MIVSCYLSVVLGFNASPCAAQAGLSLQEAIDKALQTRAGLKAEAERA
jgi:hypothetical protein